MGTMPASKSLCQAVGITVSFSWGISLFSSVPYFLHEYSGPGPATDPLNPWSWLQQSSRQEPLQLGSCNVSLASGWGSYTCWRDICLLRQSHLETLPLPAHAIPAHETHPCTLETHPCTCPWERSGCLLWGCLTCSQPGAGWSIH